MCPLLLIAGDSDDFVPMESIEALQEAVSTENTKMEDCEIIIAEGAGHEFAHHPKTEQDVVDSECLLNAAAEWLVKYLQE